MLWSIVAMVVVLRGCRFVALQGHKAACYVDRVALPSTCQPAGPMGLEAEPVEREGRANEMDVPAQDQRAHGAGAALQRGAGGEAVG